MRWWFVSDVQLASYRWHNMEDHTMEFFAPFITFCCGVVAKEQIIMTSGVWNNLKEHLLKALLPVDVGLCYPLLLNRTWWTLSIFLRAERSQIDDTSKLDQVNSANLLFELWSFVFYVLICYRICRAEQLSRGTLLQRILSRGTLIYDGTGSI